MGSETIRANLAHLSRDFKRVGDASAGLLNGASQSYVDYSIAHCNRVEKYADQLIDSLENHLSCDEAFILLSAIYLHTVALPELELGARIDCRTLSRESSTFIDRYIREGQHNQLGLYTPLIAKAVSVILRKSATSFALEKYVPEPIFDDLRIRSALLIVLLQLADEFDTSCDRIKTNLITGNESPKLTWPSFLCYYVKEITVSDKVLIRCQFPSDTPVFDRVKSSLEEKLNKRLTASRATLKRYGIEISNKPQITVCHLGEPIPDVILEHTDRLDSVVRGKANIYPRRTRTRYQKPNPPYQAPNNPFLLEKDRDWFIKTLDNAVGSGEIEGLLVDTGMDQRWIRRKINPNQPPYVVASQAIRKLELFGLLNRQRHALGALLEALLRGGLLGFDNSIQAVSMIFFYQLVQDQASLYDLSAKFQVPLAWWEEDDAAKSRDQPRRYLPAGSRREVINKKVEALWSGRKRWVDVNFLEKGARAARAVCRLEWGKEGEGTGFLIAPDRVLTNYHVIQPWNSRDSLDARIQKCELRFGATSTPDGGVSSGNLVTTIAQNGLLSASEPDQLDYALLKLKSPIKDTKFIACASLSSDPVGIGNFANIIQHPLGGPMKVSLRHNEIVELVDERVYYASDTDVGASGAPVFNDDWQVIALHCAAGLVDTDGELVLEANEGVLISSILKEIKPYL